MVECPKADGTHRQLSTLVLKFGDVSVLQLASRFLGKARQFSTALHLWNPVLRVEAGLSASEGVGREVHCTRAIDSGERRAYGEQRKRKLNKW